MFLKHERIRTLSNRLPDLIEFSSKKNLRKIGQRKARFPGTEELAVTRALCQRLLCYKPLLVINPSEPRFNEATKATR